MDLNPADFRVESWPPPVKGGMIFGTTSGICVTHIPTGITAICTTERSQHKNREIAFNDIKTRLEFEEIVRSQGDPTQGWWVRRLPDGGYSSGRTERAWKEWKERSMNALTLNQMQIETLIEFLESTENAMQWYLDTYPDSAGKMDDEYLKDLHDHLKFFKERKSVIPNELVEAMSRLTWSTQENFIKVEFEDGTHLIIEPNEVQQLLKDTEGKVTMRNIKMTREEYNNLKEFEG
jgi:hypothetical protein